MQKRFRFIVLFLVLLSCEEKEGIDNSYQFYTLQVRPDSKLKLTPRVSDDSTHKYYEYEVMSGNKAVFTLAYSVGDSTYSDGGKSETVVFEIDTAATEFNIVGPDFKNYNGLYEKSCFCTDEDANKPSLITQGQVSGIKLNSTSWKLRTEIGMITIEDTAKVEQKKIISLK
jgi:hypothetical protein